MGRFGIGQAVRRVEDVRFLTGRGRYTDDITLPGQAYALIVRSPHAHARIRDIDSEDAEKVDGVLGIYTHSDLAADGIGPIPCLVDIEPRQGSRFIRPPRPALADGAVRHVGDPVVLIVAETLSAARDAADLVLVDYEELPSVTSTAGAVTAEACQIWPEATGNLCFEWEIGDREAVDRAFNAAAHRVKLDLVNNRIIPAPMETRAAIGAYESDRERYVLYTPSQGVHSLQSQLAEDIFGVSLDNVRVVTPDVGGGFGMKIFLYPEQILVLWAARRLGRPVKWTSERNEGMLSDSHGRDHVTHAEMAVDEEGHILALRVSNISNLGAYLSNFGPYIATSAGVGMLSGLYRTPAIYEEVRGVFTNTAPVDAYRGAGRPEANYIVERLIDITARSLGLGPDEIRRRNYITPDEMPFTTPLGLVYDSGDFEANMADAMAAAGWSEKDQRRTDAAGRGKLYGIGLATYIESCGGGPTEKADIYVDSIGCVTISIGTQSNGQGHETAYAQIAADILGQPIERVRVIQGDTDLVSYGSGTGGSRSIPVGGVATNKAAHLVIEAGRRFAVGLLEAAEEDITFADGRYTIVGTDRHVDLAAVAAAADREGEPLRADAFQEPCAPTFPNGCHVCEVEIDRETGAIEIVNYNVVDDFGRLINPLLVEGQVHGGIAQGIGQALFESCFYDPESGQLLSASFLDYALPRADELPAFSLSYNQVPSTTNPMGLKGAGEAGSIGTPPAVVNAVVDALAEFGIRHIDMPISQQKIWRILRELRGA